LPQLVQQQQQQQQAQQQQRSKVASWLACSSACRSWPQP
jgi:hypothetical protein